jgi:hypothetical protein
MKKTFIVDGGFGMFVLRAFHQNEFITAYIGKRIDYKYMYNDLVSIPTSWKTNGMQEEFWLGHRINHGGGGKNNVDIYKEIFIWIKISNYKNLVNTGNTAFLVLLTKN